MSEDRPPGTKSRLDAGIGVAEVERAVVESLGQHQIEKLAENRHKAHWKDASCVYLLRRLEEEVRELELAMMEGHFLEADEVIRECADVANMAAMIADNWKFGRGIP